jgi:hypothetical protein
LTAENKKFAVEFAASGAVLPSTVERFSSKSFFGLKNWRVGNESDRDESRER